MRTLIRAGSVCALLLLVLSVVGGCSSSPPRTALTSDDLRRLEALATEMGLGRMASIRHDAPEIRIGLLDDEATEGVPAGELEDKLRPFADRAIRELRGLQPPRSFRFTLYSPLDGMVMETAYDTDGRQVESRETLQNLRILDTALFSHDFPLSEPLRRGFYLPFVGLSEVALSWGAKEAAYIHLSKPSYERIRPHLEAMACGGRGNPQEMRFSGLQVSVVAAPGGMLVAEYPLPRMRLAKSLTFSPDGRSLAFLGRRQGNDDLEPWKVWVVDRGTGTVRALFAPPAPDHPRGVQALGWSADGTMLAMAVEGLPARQQREGNPADWVSKDRVLIYSRDGKALGQIPGRCPSWHPSNRSLLLVRDIPRDYRVMTRRGPRQRRRWIHQVVHVTLDDEGKSLNETVKPTEGWVFNPPIWLRGGQSYLTVENQTSDMAYGWRRSGAITRHTFDERRSELLGLARLSGSPDGSAFILRTGRLWRWIVPGDEPKGEAQKRERRDPSPATQETNRPRSASGAAVRPS